MAPCKLIRAFRRITPLVLEHRLPLLILVIFIAGLCARVAFLDADPPSFLSHNLEYADEGIKAHNARNFVLYGRYIADDFNEPIFSYPCHTVLLSMFLKVFGVHLVTVRMFSIVCACVTFWLVYLVMRREQFGGSEIVLALLFYWASSFYLFLNRIGFIEPLVFMWFLLMYGAIYLSRRGIYWTALAGVFLAAAVFSKAIAVIILPAVAVCLLWGPNGFELARAKSCIYFIIGAASASILSYLLVVRIDPNEYMRFNESILNTAMFIESFGRFFPNLFNEYRDFFILAQFPLAVVFCISFFLYHLGRDMLREKGFLIFMVLWFFGAMLFLSLIDYRPPRYYLLAVPPIAILAGIGAGRFLTEKERGLRDYLYCAGIIVGILFVSLIPLGNAATVGGTPGISPKLMVEFSIGAGLCVWLIVFLFRLRRLLKPIVVTGIICFLIFNTAVVYRAYSDLRYETVRIGRFIYGAIGERDALIAGRVEEFIFDYGRYNGYVPYRTGRDLTIFSSPWTHVFEDRTAIPEHTENLNRAMEKYSVMERSALMGSIQTGVMPDGRRHEYYLYEVVR